MKLINNYTLTDTVRSAKTFRTPKNLILMILIFAGIFLIISMAESMPRMVVLMPSLLSWTIEQSQLLGENFTDAMIYEHLANMLTDPSLMFAMLLCTGFGTLTAIIYCRFAEGRKLRTMGFRGKDFVPQYLVGLVAGFVMFSLIVLLSWAMGGLSANGLQNAAAGGLIVMFIGYVVQGMSEEVIFRGYFMTTILRYHKPWVAVLINSIGFALVHGGNPGIDLFHNPLITILAMINLTLFGVTASLWMLRTGSIWGACAIHSIWNFVQGNFYGLPVSGTNSGDSVFSFGLVEGMGWANGGAFGIEASLATTIVLGVIIAALLFVPSPKKKEAPAEVQA